MSKRDVELMEEAFDEGLALLAETGVTRADLEKADVFCVFESGFWFCMAGFLTVLERHGYFRLPKDGESRE